MKPAYILVFFLLVVSGVFALFSFKEAIAHHVDIRQAMVRPGETVQVPGLIDKASVVYDTQKGELRFDILGMDPKTRKPDSSMRLTVAYAQPKPENFDTATSVEATGKYENGVFRADSLLVKCPTKYADERPIQGKE